MLELLPFLPVVVPILSLFYLISVGIYNVFFHPLRQYPGPILMKMSRLPYAYLLYRGTNTEKTKRLHDTYGNVVRVAPNQLSYISSQAWTDIYGFGVSEQRGNFHKDPEFYIKAPSGIDTMITANEADHRRMRRLQSHAFSEKALALQEPLLTSYVDLFISRLQDHVTPGGPNIIDLVQWYNFATFDILGDLAFGESFRCLERGILHPWIRNIFVALKAATLLRETFLYPAPLKQFLYWCIPRELIAGRKDSFDFAASKARQRLQQVTDRPDFMSYILSHNDEKGMTQPEIEVTAALLITAGSETTATLLSGLTHQLLLNPSHLQKLTSLIRATFASPSSITLNSLSQIPYLHAVLQEGLRMYPPVPSALLRVTPGAGGMVNGAFVPPGTKVGVTQYAAYSSVSNFAEPETFAPERWEGLDVEGNEKFKNDDRKVLQPFSVGPRNCIGKNLAYAEMRMILARLLWHFDLELMEGGQAWAKKQKVFTLWEKGDMMVRLTPRTE